MICAVVVSYNPVFDNLSKLIETLNLFQVVPVLVDNGSDEKATYDCENINLERNLGIAKAQNIGIETAIKLGAKAIVFFDQDSTISDISFIDKLYAPIAEGHAKITAPIFIDEKLGFTYPIVEITKSGGRIKHYPTPETKNFFVNHAISSGTMVETSTLLKIGDMKADLFIDYVDTEWCLRAESLGFKVLIIPSAAMLHSIGDKTLKVGSFYIPKHSPFRRYYRIRNSFYLLRLSYVPKLMALREILFAIAHQTILILFSKGERLQYLKSLFKGLMDGVLGRFG
jgi:rhamnosyltransferase